MYVYLFGISEEVFTRIDGREKLEKSSFNLGALPADGKICYIASRA